MKVNKVLSKTIFAALSGTCMFFSSNNVLAQVKIGSNPSTIDANNNLEVEASTAGRKTAINKSTGQVTIADGTQGAGKVFTSDANGIGSWMDNKTSVAFGVVGTLPTLLGGQTAASTDFKKANMAISLPPGKWLIFLNATYKNELNGPCNLYWDLSTSSTVNTTTSRVVGASAPFNNYMPVSAIYNVEVTGSAKIFTFFIGIPGSTSGQATYSGEARVFAIPMQ